MTHTNITFRAIAPIYSPLNLSLGVDQFAPDFIKTLKQIGKTFLEDNKSLENVQGQFKHFGGQQNEDIQYQSTDKNSKDVRLMCWSPANDDSVLFHVFTNNITVAEIELTLNIEVLQQNSTSTEAFIKAIEDQVQLIARAKIKDNFQAFHHDTLLLSSYLSDDFEATKIEGEVDISWVARTLLLNNEQLTHNLIPIMLTQWLKKTGRPEDAADIIAGTKNNSLTWLNYVVKDPDVIGEDPYIQMMVLSQYYYVSQEHCNSALRGAIEVAYARKNKQKVDQVLAKTRTACRLNQIAFYENIKFLTRPNRALLEDILHGWKFEQLVENSERMIEICDARIQEEDNKKRERSTVMTDFLLVALSFFAVFELSLYLTEFSREMMSRPALDYNDNKSSFFLGLIAEVDADIMFSFGFGLTLLLILVYRYIKRN